MDWRGITNIAAEIMDPTGDMLKDRIKTARERENKLNDIRANALYDALKSGKISDPKEREATWAEIVKIYGGTKAAKEAIGYAKEADDMVQKMLSGSAVAPSQQPSQQGTAQGQAQAQTGPGFVGSGPLGPSMGEPTRMGRTGGPLSTGPFIPDEWNRQGPATPPTPPAEPTPPPAPESTLAPPPSVTRPRFSSASVIAAANPSLEEQNTQFTQLFPNATDAERMNWLAGRQLASTAQPQNKPMNLGSFTGEDGYQYQKLLFPGENEVRTVRSDVKVQTKAVRPVNARAQMSVKEAIAYRDAMAAKGETVTYPDLNGKPIDLDTLNQVSPDMKIMGMTGTDNQLHWTYGNQNQVLTTAGGQVMASGEFERTHLPEGAGVTLGPSQIPTSTMRETAGLDPATGQSITIPLETTRVPITPGVSGRTTPTQTQPKTQTPPQPPLPPLSSPSITSTTSTEVKSPAQADTKQPPVLKTAGSSRLSSRPLPGISAAVYNQWVPRVIPIQEAASQTIGDPDHPEYKSLASFAYLADDPVASQAIANAMRATLDGIKSNPKVHGDLVNLIKLEVGLPQEVIRQETDAMRSMVADTLGGHPEWMACYNSLIASYATMMGMRAATKAPASEFTSVSLEREIPVPGLYVSDSRAFHDKLAKIAMEVNNAVKKIPAGLLDERYKNYYSSKISEYTTLSKGGKLTPPPGATTTAPATPQKQRIRYDNTGRRIQ